MGTNEKGRHLSGRLVSPGYRTDVLEALARLLAERPEVTQGKMFGFPAFYTAGKLFACVYGEGVGLKLPGAVIRTLDGKPGVTPFRPYGKPRMKEWILLRHDRAETYAEYTRLILASIAFVGETAHQSKKSKTSKRSPKRS